MFLESLWACLLIDARTGIEKSLADPHFSQTKWQWAPVIASQRSGPPPKSRHRMRPCSAGILSFLYAPPSMQGRPKTQPVRRQSPRKGSRSALDPFL